MGNAAKNVMTPPTDVYENATEYLIVADLPGVAPEDVVVELHRGELLIRGDDVGSSFERRFSVPNGIPDEQLSAVIADGVLELRLPKPVAERPRQIPVSVG